MPDNFHYLYQHGRHESETYDLTECCHRQIGYAEYTVQAQFAREKFILKKSLLILFYHFCISLEILILFLLYFLYPLLLFFLYR